MAPGGRDCAILGLSRAQVTKPSAFQPLLGASRQNPVLSGQEPFASPPACPLCPDPLAVHPSQGHPQRVGITAWPGDWAPPHRDTSLQSLIW